jgi:hypothetical protein
MCEPSTSEYYSRTLSLNYLARLVNDCNVVLCKINSRVCAAIYYLKSSVFWDIMSCIPLKVNRRFGGTYRLIIQDRRISQARNQCEAGRKKSSYSSETSVDFQRTTRRYIPEGRTLHKHRCENLKSCSMLFICKDISRSMLVRVVFMNLWTAISQKRNGINYKPWLSLEDFYRKK